MKPRPRLRWDENASLEELRSSLNSVFSGASTKIITKAEATKHWNKLEKKKTWVTWNPTEKSVIGFLFPGDGPQTPCGGVELKPVQIPKELDIDFANDLGRVFNEDVRTAPDFLGHSELWMSLRQTQFRRAIARFSPFSTLPMVRWMQIVESSTSLRYEGKPFTFCMFMSKQLKWITEPIGSRFVAFGTPLSFEKAILKENWIRAAVDGSRVALLGIGHSGNVVGMIAIGGYKGEVDKWPFAPHESLVGVQDLLGPGTMIFITSEHGDVYMMLPNGSVFHKTQGRWQYLNYEATFSLFSDRLPKELATSTLRMALDLSYERRGALLCIVKQRESIQKLIPDHEIKGRANEALRKSVKGLNINEINQRQIIAAAATADGAVIVDSEGIVLDAACMVGDPSLTDVEAVGQDQLQRMPGARSTAAWNASIYGIAIKVSEDGPITIYERGQLIGQVG